MRQPFSLWSFLVRLIDASGLAAELNMHFDVSARAMPGRRPAILPSAGGDHEGSSHDCVFKTQHFLLDCLARELRSSASPVDSCVPKKGSLKPALRRS